MHIEPASTATASDYNVAASFDLTDIIAGADPVTKPVRMDLSVKYCMPDTSLSAAPYAV